MKNLLIVATLSALIGLTAGRYAQTTSATAGKYDYAVMSIKACGENKNKVMVLYNDGKLVDYSVLKKINQPPNFIYDQSMPLKAIQAMDEDGYELVCSNKFNYSYSLAEYVFRKPKEVK